MTKKFLIFTLVFILMATFSYAHDFWIEKKDGKYYIVSGHDDKWDNYDPLRVKDAKVFSVTGSPVKVDVVRQNDIAYILPKADIGAISVFFDNHYWVKTTEGWKNITKQEAIKQGFQVIESGQSFKYAKYIERWSDNFGNPLETRMEIIPLKNPFAIKQGQKLPLKVLLDGRPLGNAPVFLHAKHEEFAKTDKHGQVDVVIDPNKMNIISVTTRLPYKDNPDADQLYLRASLSFGGR